MTESATSKPLHVQVAEALGWKLVPIGESKLDFCREGGTEAWIDPEGNSHCARCDGMPPKFDRSWCEIGKIVFDYKISILFDDGWQAWEQGYDLKADGKTPMEAVCRLILKLKEEGLLNV